MNVGTFNFTNLLICIYEEDQAALILYEAVDTLEASYKDKDIMEAVAGIIMTIGAVQQARQGLPACLAVDTNWTELNKVIDIVEHPTKHMEVIGKDIFFNGKVITKEIQVALEAYRSGDFNGFGRLLAEATLTATDVSKDNLFLY